MDGAMDTSEIGRFGTLRFMKRLDPEAMVAAYPIDEEEITLGRDPACSVRLYYQDVSLVHCKIVFEERKVRSARSLDIISAHELLGLLSSPWYQRCTCGRLRGFPFSKPSSSNHGPAHKQLRTNYS